jgi:hypothetical protein
MRQWSLVILFVLGAAFVATSSRLTWFRTDRIGAHPHPVPDGDQELAWLHNPTSFESWDNFVWAMKRAEMALNGGPPDLEVDDAEAFPSRTTAVPELIVRRKGYAGSLRIRWYKVTDEATQEAWVNALAERRKPPLAIMGGWSSDRAKELAVAMRDRSWPGVRPLLFLATATADRVDSDDDALSGDQRPSLISVYDPSFRFCFTNRQMADAVTDFVLSDPTLRPGPIGATGMHAVPAFGAGPLAGIAALAGEIEPRATQAFAIEWRDDPYSTDLSLKFREAFRRMGDGPTRLEMEVNPVPFSTGRMNRPNPVEAEIAEHILQKLPEPGVRTALVVPSVLAPIRRVLRTLVQGNPMVGRRLVAVTGDGLGVNTFFRDRDFAWPVRSLPIPVVMFTHADPFAWDLPGAQPAPPRGYELEPPTRGGVKSSTEDVQLFSRLAQVMASGLFPPGKTAIAGTPSEVAEQFRTLKPAFFDAEGNRLSGDGEHIVVLRPVFPGEAPPEQPYLDALLEVYTRQSNHHGWRLLHTQMLGHNPAGRSD